MHASAAPRRGRPPLATREQVLEQIRELARDGRLFRAHLSHPALYARARRHHGTWAAALTAAGVAYEQVLADARRRSLDGRRRPTDSAA
ncbi:MAG: hypothetical protein U0704_14950 [Candidatus Eisenbacteria bacterium]